MQVNIFSGFSIMPRCHPLVICIPRFRMPVREHQNIPAIHHQSAIIIGTLKTKGVT